MNSNSSSNTYDGVNTKTPRPISATGLASNRAQSAQAQHHKTKSTRNLHTATTNSYHPNNEDYSTQSTQQSVTSSSLSLNNHSSSTKSTNYGHAPYSNTNNIRSSAFSMGVNKIGLNGEPLVNDHTCQNFIGNLENFSSSNHVSLTLTIKLDPRANLIDKPSLAKKQHQVVGVGRGNF